MPLQYTQKEMHQLIGMVEKEFSAHLNKAEEFKSKEEAPKAEEKEEKKPEESKEEPKDEKKEEPKHEEAAHDEANHEEKPEEKHDEKHAEAEQEHEGHGEEGHDYDDQDMDHMHKMYSSMSRGELKAHHDSVRKALDGHSAAPQEDMHMAKSEEIKSVEVNPEIIKATAEVEILKSEVAAQKTENEELKKSLEAVTAFITKWVGQKPAPAAKAITHVEAITKGEAFKEEKQLTKSEITEVLNRKSADPKLAKSDRDAINAYYLNKASINTISHLLK